MASTYGMTVNLRIGCILGPSRQQTPRREQKIPQSRKQYGKMQPPRISPPFKDSWSRIRPSPIFKRVQLENTHQSTEQTEIQWDFDRAQQQTYSFAQTRGDLKP